MKKRLKCYTAQRALVVALLGAVTLTGGQSAFAYDDAGVNQFFQSGSGTSAGESAPAVVSTPGSAHSFSNRVSQKARSFRSLTVKLHDKAPTKISVAELPTKPSRVSILTDRTLRRGDAVMTADGIYIFAGSAAWPYTKNDFVPLVDAKHIDKESNEVLSSLNRRPGS